METKHSLTHLENKLSAILIDTFSRHGWKINDLPDILDSDVEQINSQFDWDYDGYLGVYRPTDNKGWCQMGEVVLFQKNILKVAENFYTFDNYLKNPETGEFIKGVDGEKVKKGDLLHFITAGSQPDYGIYLEDSVQYLNAIVLIHELAHWVIHWSIDFNEKTLRCHFDYNTIDQKNFHEGLAQYFTQFVLKLHGNNKMCDLFEFLKAKQSAPYRIFEELQTDLDNHPIKIGCLFSALGVCWFKEFKQSFNDLKQYNLLAVLYDTYDHIESFNSITKQVPVPDQKRIMQWWNMGPFQDKNNLFLEPFLSDENKNLGKVKGKRFGI